MNFALFKTELLVCFCQLLDTALFLLSLFLHCKYFSLKRFDLFLAVNKKFYLAGSQSGNYVGWFNAVMLYFKKNACRRKVEWAHILSWWSIQDLFFYKWGLRLLTPHLFMKVSQTLGLIMLTDWDLQGPSECNHFYTCPKKLKIMTLNYDFLIFYFFYMMS